MLDVMAASFAYRCPGRKQQPAPVLCNTRPTPYSPTAVSDRTGRARRFESSSLADQPIRCLRVCRAIDRVGLGEMLAGWRDVPGPQRANGMVTARSAACRAVLGAWTDRLGSVRPVRAAER